MIMGSRVALHNSCLLWVKCDTAVKNWLVCKGVIKCWLKLESVYITPSVSMMLQYAPEYVCVIVSVCWLQTLLSISS